MGISRCSFLKVSAAGGLGISALGFDLKPAYAASRQLKIRNALKNTRPSRPWSWICGVKSRSCGRFSGTCWGSERGLIPFIGRYRAEIGDG